MKLNPFRHPTADEIIEEQVQDAQRMLLAHEAAREHHQAQVSMYRLRLARLGKTTLKHPSGSAIGDGATVAPIRRSN